MVFSELLELVLQDGVTDKKLQFPFNSLVLANGTGLYHYLCFQKHPSYFLYPDLASAPQGRPEPWLAHPKKHYLVVTNTLLSTVKQ